MGGGRHTRGRVGCDSTSRHSPNGMCHTHTHRRPINQSIRPIDRPTDRPTPRARKPDATHHSAPSPRHSRRTRRAASIRLKASAGRVAVGDSRVDDDDVEAAVMVVGAWSLRWLGWLSTACSHHRQNDGGGWAIIGGSGSSRADTPDRRRRRGGSVAVWLCCFLYRVVRPHVWSV